MIHPVRSSLLAALLLLVASSAATGGPEDCNGNGTPDDFDIAHNISEDCNGNGVPDECDITGGLSEDCDGNGIPDDCDTRIEFAPHPVFPSAFSVRASDIDDDGDLDVVVDDGGIYWGENEGDGTFGTTHVVDVDLPGLVDAADLDGDGDPDILASYAGEAFWFENLGGGFGPRTQISPTQSFFSWSMPVAVADLDGDSDPDVLQIYSFDDPSDPPPPDELVWYENLDGGGQFGSPQSIYTGDDTPLFVDAADVDGDGDRDVVCGHAEQLVWYENDGTGVFTSRPIDVGAGSVYADDIDADGDPDLLVLSWGTTAELVWYENLDGKGTFVSRSIDDDDFTTDAALMDLDGDGDLDAVAVSESQNDIAWYENLDGRGTFGPRSVLLAAAGVWPVLDQPGFGDLDGDGDLDVLHDAGQATWMENLSDDCNGNELPDACEADCNASGIVDSCDLTAGTSVDCDHNAVPDECDAACTNCNADEDVCLDEQDCAPDDASVWSEPTAVTGLRLWGGAPTALSWQPPAFAGADSVRYDTLRSSSASSFLTETLCLDTDGTDTASEDADEPPPGELFHYLVRVENDCPGGVGSMGTDSAGAPRSGTACF